MMFNLLPKRPEFVDYVARLERAGASACNGARSAARRCMKATIQFEFAASRRHSALGAW